MRLRTLFALIIISTTIFNCAKRGRPTGGPKDENAPILVSTIPVFKATNFKSNEIRITFDEFIKLKDLNKQLVISPPMKYQPIITPQGTPSKYINIKILDTLKENTTYTFNFGQSVIDNNEGNVLNNFKYIFSTGNTIDSLKISGVIKDAFNEKADKDVSIMLYELNEDFKDSVIYKEKPFYVANTLDTTVWEITNIKQGKYKLIALKDASRDYKFNPKQDKIAFLEKEINIPNDSVGHELILFKEVLNYKLNRPSESTNNRLLFGYEGIADSIKIKNLIEAEKIESIITFEKDKDSLNYWYKNTAIDSLYLEAINGVHKDTVSIKRRSKVADSLTISTNVRGTLLLRDKLKIISNIPLERIDTTKIKFIDKDSSNVNYKVKFVKQRSEVILDFEKKYDNNYKLELLPNTVEDFYGNVNDTLNFSFATKKPADYGSVYLSLQNVNSFPIIVQLIDSNTLIVDEIYATKNQEFTFKNLEPGKYKIRVIYDDNKNGKWDTGNFLKNLQPEKVVYFPTELDVRANWEMTETFVLK